jgi:hypothetical protein
MVFNPFKRHDHDIPGVVVPLGSAPAHFHPALDEKKLGPDEKADDRSDRAPSEENGVATSLPDNSHLTLEILRAEVESDISSSGLDSAYDRMSLYCCLCNNTCPLAGCALFIRFPYGPF